MQDKINEMMERHGISFGELAATLGISKQTLTKKVLGNMDWTYKEMTKLIELFHIEEPQDFFFR